MNYFFNFNPPHYFQERQFVALVAKVLFTLCLSGERDPEIMLFLSEERDPEVSYAVTQQELDVYINRTAQVHKTCIVYADQKTWLEPTAERDCQK